jgi:tetratricopeptide (TPR) repeat protein
MNVYRETNDLKHMMDLHDFASAEDTIKKIQADAPDFDAPPIVSAIKEGEQVSNLALLSAQQAAMTGDNDRMQSELAKAIQLWPLNPDIDTFSKESRNASNMMANAAPKFDELLAHGDDRQIYEMKNELGMALFNDPDRSAKLSEIVNRVGKVEMLIGLSDAAMKQNNGYAAWESLVSAAKLEPDDPVLALAQRNVSSRVANFVEALDSADRADKAGDYAASLNYYLQAQDIYPVSILSHDGIDAVGKKLMAAINPTGRTAKDLANQPDSSSPAPDASGAPSASMSSPNGSPGSSSNSASGDAPATKSLF